MIPLSPALQTKILIAPSHADATHQANRAIAGFEVLWLKLISALEGCKGPLAEVMPSCKATTLKAADDPA